MRRVHPLFATAALFLVPHTMMACAVCLGDSDLPVRPAINGAIFLMLGCIGTMLTGVGGFAFYLFRRSQLPHPPHEEFLQLQEED